MTSGDDLLEEITSGDGDTDQTVRAKEILGTSVQIQLDIEKAKE
jgi:hypothetical protein